jgi:hypothetical protein
MAIGGTVSFAVASLGGWRWPEARSWGGPILPVKVGGNSRRMSCCRRSDLGTAGRCFLRVVHMVNAVRTFGEPLARFKAGKRHVG